jgi:hypothetical protein
MFVTIRGAAGTGTAAVPRLLTEQILPLRTIHPPHAGVQSDLHDSVYGV